MVYEALLRLHSMSPSFSMTSATGAPATAAASTNMLLDGDGAEGAPLQVDAPSKRRRVVFNFSAFQRQHEQGAWILSTLSCGGGAAAAAAPQSDAEFVTVTNTACTHSIHPDDLALSTWYQKQQRHEEQDQKVSPPFLHLRAGLSSPAPRRPCLVVGPGQFGWKVGLLGGLQPPELTKYLTPEEGGAFKPPRAPRTDLSHLTQKEKEDRHREQARLHYHLKREQALLLEAGLEQEVTQMRTYQQTIDMAPFVTVVLSATINNCRILYVNKPVTEKLGHEVANLLGRSFVMMTHPQDQPHLSSVLNECIRTSQPHHGRVLCRFWCMKGVGINYQPFKQMDMTVNFSTKGLICNLWEVRGDPC